jgi:diguanylate cyclase (GGDEF)-like protein/PAS domain S-box-containing protein
MSRKKDPEPTPAPPPPPARRHEDAPHAGHADAGAHAAKPAAGRHADEKHAADRPAAGKHDDAHGNRHAPKHADAPRDAAKGGAEAPPAALLESVPYPLFAKDIDGRYLYANVQYCALVGSALDAILGRTDRDFFPADKAERLRGEDRRVLETGGPVDTREESRRPDGTTPSLRGTKAPLRGPHGRIVGVLGVLVPAGEGSLPETPGGPARLLATLMETAPAFIYFKDAGGHFLRINRALAARYGIADPAQAAGKTDFDFYPPADAERFRHDEEEILRTGRPIVAREERGTYADGKASWTSTTKMPLRDVDGRIVGVFGISHDVTALREQATARAEQAAQLDALLDLLPDAAWFKDAEGRYRLVNRPCAAALGLADPSQAAGKTDADLLPAAEAERSRAADAEALRAAGPLPTQDESRTDAQGRPAWRAVARAPLRDAEGKAVGTLGLARDISDRKRAESALGEQGLFLASLMDGLPDSLYFKDAQGRYLRVNRAQASRLGLKDPAEAVGKTDADLLPREQAEAAKKDDDEILRTGTPLLGKEEPHPLPDGSVTWSSTTKTPLRDRDGRVVGTMGLARDITDLKRAQERLVQHAFYDSLTGLPNRALFMDRLEHCIRRTLRRPDVLSAVLFLDVDRFKGVNDSLGHQAGDQLLYTVARRLERSLRPGDTIARLGGDEFVVLLEDIVEVPAAARVAKRILQDLVAPCAIAGVEVFASVSIGIALSSNRYERPEEMLRDADTAMYRAKALGRSRYEVFDAAMHERAVQMLQTETDLRRALERREFLLLFQPIVALADRRLLGFEALLRWRHPQRGLLLPADFLPLAEETGLINPIGLWSIREACRQVRDWQQRHPSPQPLRLSVNVSRRQLVQKDFVDQIRRILDDTRFDPATLTLEIAENALLESLQATADILSRIRALSIQLHVDDFGAWGGAAGQLPRLPINTLKVDQAFISRIPAGNDPGATMKAIMALAQSLGLGVTAEGVETPEQLEALRALKCGSGQGFLFSQPLEPGAVEALLAKKTSRW